MQMRLPSIVLMSTVALLLTSQSARCQGQGAYPYPQQQMPAQAPPPDQNGAPDSQQQAPSTPDGQAAAPPPGADQGAPPPPQQTPPQAPPTVQPPAPVPAAPAGPQSTPPSGQDQPKEPESKDLTIQITETTYCTDMEKLLGYASPNERQSIQQNPLFREGPVDQKLYVKGKKARIDFDNVAILIDANSHNNAAIIDPFAHVYSVLGPDDSSDPTGDEILNGVPVVTKTGEKAMIAGHPCDHYTVHGVTIFGKLTGDVWTAEDLDDIDPDFYDQSLSLQGLWSQIPGYVMYEDLAIYTDDHGKVNVSLRLKDEVHSVVKGDLPANYFLLPPGFHRVPLGPNGMPLAPQRPKLPAPEDQTAT